ncbi:hypothetical protein BDZ45DRAFT_796889 [Acephala macrosclerotiorum]|nr:hypothetical protein BDZ45DRAFT_796889 [Acephala macrosclerotiorum]
MYRSFVPLVSAETTFSTTPSIESIPNGLQMQPPPLPAKQRRHHHSDEEWEEHKDVITLLFHENTTEEVMMIMRRDYNFHAGLRQYKTKTKAWGLGKNIKTADAKIMLTKQSKRKLESDAETMFVFGGAQVEERKLERIKKRAAVKAAEEPSPSASTPGGVMYYTPSSEIVGYPSPEISRTFASSPSANTFLSGILVYDEEPQEVTIIRVYTEALTTPRDHKPLEGSPGYLHQGGARGLLSRGRFRGTTRAAHFLSEAHSLTAVLVDALHGPQSPNNPKIKIHTNSTASAKGRSPPEFFYGLQNYTKDHKSAMDAFMTTVKHHRLCAEVLGLNRKDRSLWLREWTPFEEADADQVGARANTLLGDLLHLYPSMSILSLFVRFYLAASSKRPVLLRVAVAVDPRRETQECDFCDYGFFRLDYLGPEGAVRINNAFSKRNLYQEFLTEHLLTTSQKLRWSETAPIQQGWSHMPVLMGCQHDCGILLHRTGQHGRQEWNTTTDSDHTSFQPFPLDDPVHICTVAHRGRKAIRAVFDTHRADFKDYDGGGVKTGEEDKFDAMPAEKTGFENFPEDDVFSEGEFCFKARV